MKEYKLKINGEMDFIIISPQVLSSLISKIHNSSNFEASVDVEEIMPPGFTDYLIRVINANRFENEKFRYDYILEDPITKKGLYEILRQQLSEADIDAAPCFRTINLANTIRGKVELDMECNKPFFWACKDSSAEFIYSYSDGQQETLVIEY